jgi:hypothetical protein
LGGRFILGVVLVVIGVISLAYQGFTYTTHKKVIDLGPIQATEAQRHTVSLPPLVGVLSLIGGVVVLTTGRRAN